MRYVLDADVLIGALDGSDPHHAQARRLFAAWHEHGDSTLMSVINLSEVLVAPAKDPSLLRTARRAIATLGVSVHSPTEAIAVQAARLRGLYPISLPDAYLLATSWNTASPAVSFDRNVVKAAREERIPVAQAAARS